MLLSNKSSKVMEVSQQFIQFHINLVIKGKLEDKTWQYKNQYI